MKLSDEARRDDGSGRVVSVNLSDSKGVRKTPVRGGLAVLERGFEGDAHAGDWHRQISLLARESIQSMVEKGLNVGAGDFAENVTTEGIDLLSLKVGTVLAVGGATLEITQIGKTCHNRCAIYYQAGDCVMPKEGIFAAVKEAGRIAVGDPIQVIGAPVAGGES